MNQHVKAGIRLVGTVLIHRLLPFHARERGRHVHANGFFHHPLDQPFGHCLNFFWFGKGHFGVDLGEFRLAVTTQVFVAEALSDLVVLVHPGGHQELLEELRRLWQGVEVTRVNPGRHDVIAGPFRRRAGQFRRFHVQKVVIIKVVVNN